MSPSLANELAKSLRVRASAGDPGVTVKADAELGPGGVWIATGGVADLFLRRQRLALRLGLPAELLDHHHQLNFEP